MSIIKIGAPIIAVKIEIGSSITETVLDKASIRTINPAPKLMPKGKVWVLFAPIIMRTRWGIISPIHPICPQIETLDAVIIVDVSIKINLLFFTFMPRDFASSSDRERRFKLQVIL